MLVLETVDEDEENKDITTVKYGEHEIGVSTAVATTYLLLNKNGISLSESDYAVIAANEHEGALSLLKFSPPPPVWHSNII